jgi:hypothetical protein
MYIYSIIFIEKITTSNKRQPSFDANVSTKMSDKPGPDKLNSDKVSWYFCFSRFHFASLSFMDLLFLIIIYYAFLAGL